MTTSNGAINSEPLQSPRGQARALRELFADSLLRYPIAGPMLVLIVAIAVFALFTTTFFNFGNLALIVQQSVVIGTLALGQTLIILIAGIDLANGAIMVLGTVLIGSYASHGSIVVAVVFGLIACLAVSAINGIIVSRFKLPPFIATLGMYTIVAAGARLYTQSRSYPVNSDTLTILGIGPASFSNTVTYGCVLWVISACALGYALRQTAWGVWVYAIGNSPSAARLNGIKVTGVIFSVYAVAGLFYFLAAMQAIGRTPIADPSGYPTGNLDSITAVVIGGTSLFGGRGGVAGTCIGALIVGVLKNGLTQAGIDSLYQQIATGLLIILAVGADHYVRRGQRG